MGTWPHCPGARGSTRPTGYPVCHASAPSVPSAQRCPPPWPATALSAGGWLCKSARLPHCLSLGKDPQAGGQALLGKGCQQAVAGQCHTVAGGGGLALVPEQMGPSRQQERWVCVPTAYTP